MAAPSRSLYQIICLPFSISQKAPTSIAHCLNGPVHSTAAAMRIPQAEKITTPASIKIAAPNAAPNPDFFIVPPVKQDPKQAGTAFPDRQAAQLCTRNFPQSVPFRISIWAVMESSMRALVAAAVVVALTCSLAPASNAQNSQPRNAAGNSRSTTGSAGDRGITPGQHSTEAVAKMSCGSDTVVWINNESHVYHFKNNRSYGKTKQGAYMCERDARAAGAQAAQNGKRS
jgi:hypothetical protein